MKVAIIGCGLIGARRAAVARELGDELVLVADVDVVRARQVAQQHDCVWTDDWRAVVARADVDVVVVSTMNKMLAPITIAAAESGKHVLCEKPLGRNLAEAERMVEAASKAGVFLKTGFNHRHHPALWQAHELYVQGAIGPLMYVRAVYGHGSRPGFEKEWRADPDLAGGGELLDQGVHLVDLFRWFMGDFAEALAMTATCFWNLGVFTPVTANGPLKAGQQLEDNAFAILRTSDGRMAQFHTSWTQWKNRFSLEVFGREGYLRVEGLGGSYGAETLTVGHRRAESGPPLEEHYEYAAPDRSWHTEWQTFREAIREGREPLANGQDGLQAMRVIDALYRSVVTGCFTQL